MMMKRITTTVLAVAFLLTLSVGAARAGPIYTINIGSFSGGTAVIHAPGTLAGTTGLNVELGSVKITGDLGTFESYCVDLKHYVNPPTNVTTAVSTMDQWGWRTDASPLGALAGGRASWLYKTYGQQTTTGGRAALSLAIWNALYDTDFDVTSGNGFWATNTVEAYTTSANSMLGALATAQNTSTLPQAAWLQTDDPVGSSYTQDFIAPVPEPGTIALVAVGLASAAASRRRKKNER